MPVEPSERKAKILEQVAQGEALTPEVAQLLLPILEKISNDAFRAAELWLQLPERLQHATNRADESLCQEVILEALKISNTEPLTFHILSELYLIIGIDLPGTSHREFALRNAISRLSSEGVIFTTSEYEIVLLRERMSTQSS